MCRRVDKTIRESCWYNCVDPCDTPRLGSDTSDPVSSPGLRAGGVSVVQNTAPCRFSFIFLDSRWRFLIFRSMVAWSTGRLCVDEYISFPDKWPAREAGRDVERTSPGLGRAPPSPPAVCLSACPFAPDLTRIQDFKAIQGFFRADFQGLGWFPLEVSTCDI